MSPLQKWWKILSPVPLSFPESRTMFFVFKGSLYKSYLSFYPNEMTRIKFQVSIFWKKTMF